ncbi:MAG: hypothetical protein WBK28_02045 [Minisyncoccia bacterium]
MAEEETLTFYEDGQQTKLQAGDVLVYAESEGCILRDGTQLPCDVDGETTRFSMDDEVDGAPVFFALDLAAEYGLVPHVRNPEFGGDMEWEFVSRL